MMKNYLLHLLETCAPEDVVAQDAIEHALLTGRLVLSYELDTDQRMIAGQFPEIVADYHRLQARNEALLTASYGPLLDQFAP
ncbi:MAG TPA: hypothetical protein VI454_04805 [Verrucomicrobiae bacterium]